MDREVFISTWAKATTGIKELGAAVRLMSVVLSEHCGGSVPENIRLVHDQNPYKQRITISFTPLPLGKNRRWNFKVGNERDAGRFLHQAPKIAEASRERAELQALLNDAGRRCGDPTTPLLVHDEFFELLELCSNIQSRRREIAQLEKKKTQAVERLLASCVEKIDVPAELVKANAKKLLDACCKCYNREPSLLGV